MARFSNFLRNLAAGSALTLMLCNASPGSAQDRKDFSPPPKPGSVSPGLNPIEDSDCGQLRFADLSTTDAGPVQITLAVTRKDDGQPRHCLVEGYAWRNIKFRIAIPLDGWSGKVLVMGTGGQAGDFPKSYWGDLLGSPDAIKRGYVLVHHDSGHFSSGIDSKWAFNNESAMIDYGFRGGHVAGVVAKAIVERFFKRPPDKTYYHSCSNGGREALMMAQRYPWDYDGIVAGAPTMNFSNRYLSAFWVSELAKGRNGVVFDPAAADTLSKAVIAQCDKLDGRADGVLDDPRRCKVDLEKVVCRDGATSGCLSRGQADIARQIYAGPRRKDGSPLFHWSYLPGTEQGWAYRAGQLDYPREVLRYLAFSPARGPGWEPDPARIEEYARQTGLMDTLLSANNPDLRRFRDAGGKLLVYHGWYDTSAVADSVDYYETVERLMGGRESTQSFYRLFAIPGMGHCFGGPGATEFDYLGVIDQWVTAGKAPDLLIGYHQNADGSLNNPRSIAPYRSEPAPGVRR